MITTAKKPTRRQKVKKSILKNHVIFLLDKSGSMSHLTSKVREKYVELLQELKKNSEKYDQLTEVSLYQFSYSADKVYEGKNIDAAISEGMYYSANGGTALFDGISKVIGDGMQHTDYHDEDTSYLVIILTDGAENSSITQASHINELLKQVDKTGRWTVTFQCPRGGRSALTQLGIYSDNINEWDATEEGLEEATASTTCGFSSFYDGRSKGLMSSRSFYVQPDLTNVKTKDLAKLDDLSKQFNTMMVIGLFITIPVRDFIQQNNITFIKGNVYYELLKKETVRYNKQILVQDKTTGEIYGGVQARNLIGLPDNKDAKVIPGNHGKYIIYVMSTSINRKLGRGSRILVKK